MGHMTGFTASHESHTPFSAYLAGFFGNIDSVPKQVVRKAIPIPAFNLN